MRSVSFRGALLTSLVCVTFAAYGSTLQSPFLYDDLESIVVNHSIRDGFVAALRPPADTPVAGRPVVNASFALNYALTGLDPAGFRITNVLIHLLTAVFLYELIALTLSLIGDVRVTVCGARLFAAAAALLWLAHPLQTEAVTYVTQRTECLVGLFYVLTVYCASRASIQGRFGGWSIASIAACALGMGSKEVMVTAPLAVIAYDAVFARARMHGADRRWLYASLLGTWAILLVLHYGGPRAASAGFGHGVGSLQYFANQCEMILIYLARTLWPRPLTIDYGVPREMSLVEAARYALPVAALALLTAAGLLRRRAVAYLGLWFFLTLAPSSSFVPIVSEVGAERRMYLALVAPVLLAVSAAYGLLFGSSLTSAKRRAMVFLAAPTLSALLVAEITLTRARNEDYATPLRLWRSAVLARPDNARARSNLGRALIDVGRYGDAETELNEALRIDPNFAVAHFNLGLVRLASPSGKDGAAQAVAEFSRALQIDPGYAAAHNNLGIALARLGRRSDALASFRRAVEADPGYTTARFNLAKALADEGRADDAIALYGQIVSRDPDYLNAHTNMAVLLAKQGRFSEALPHFARAVDLAPDDARARNNLAAVFDSLGRRDDARREYEKARSLAAAASSPGRRNAAASESGGPGLALEER